MSPPGQSLHLSCRLLPTTSLQSSLLGIPIYAVAAGSLQESKSLTYNQVHKKHLEVNDRKWEPEGSTWAWVSLSQETPAQGRGSMSALSGDARNRHWRHHESHSTGFIPEDSKCTLVPGKMTSAS